RAAGDRTGQARTLRQIAQLHKNTGAYDRAIARAREALDLYQALGDAHETALSLVVIGATHDSAGDHRLAHERLDGELPAFGGGGSHDVVNLLNEIGITQKNLGRYDDARATYARGLALARAIDDPPGAAFLSLNLAVLFNTIGDAEQAVTEGRAALALARR